MKNMLSRVCSFKSIQIILLYEYVFDNAFFGSALLCQIFGIYYSVNTIFISECSTGIENDDDNNNNSSSNTSSVTSGKNSSNTWIFVGLGIAIAVLLTGAVICSYCRYRNLCSVDEGTEATTEDEREIDSMLHVGDEATSKV